jgi:hypothetical protein
MNKEQKHDQTKNRSSIIANYTFISNITWTPYRDELHLI